MWSLSCSMCSPKMTARWVVGWFAFFIPFSAFWHVGQVFVTSVQMTGRGESCWALFIHTEKFIDSDLCSMFSSVGYIWSIKDVLNNFENFGFLWNDKCISITHSQWRGFRKIFTVRSDNENFKSLRTVAIHVLHQVLFSSGCHTSWICITTSLAESMPFFLFIYLFINISVPSGVHLCGSFCA